LIFEDIACASLVKSQSLIGSFFIPGVGVRDDLVRAKENGLDFVRIGQNPATWTSAVELIEVAISLDLKVFFNLLKSHLVSPHEFAKIAGTLSELPLDGIYLVDSTGTFTPDDVRAYILEAREYTSRALGFHGHDNLGLAHANSLMAWNCGALHVDGTLMGIGRGGGNASTERLSGLRKKFGLEDAIDTSSLCQVSSELGKALERENNDFAYLNIVCGILGFHSSWLTTASEIADTYGVASYELIAEVSAINRENPARDLFEQVAQAIASRSPSL
jgi:isopropylmalate/homocitrate/citramalate synthase